MNKNELESFLSKIKRIQGLMTYVAVGGYNPEQKISEKDGEYQDLYKSIKADFASLKKQSIELPNRNEFTSLWEFQGYWKSKNLGWQGRRDCINDIFSGIEQSVSSILEGSLTVKSPNPKTTSAIAEQAIGTSIQPSAFGKNMKDTNQHLRVFLCHASPDKPKVEILYHRLVQDGIDAWLDKEKLIPGQEWEYEIPKAVKNSHVVLVCLSAASITREGYVQKEIKVALDSADEKPVGTIFIIPTRLESCSVPERISRFQWADLFLDNGYERLFQALKLRAADLGIKLERNVINESPKTKNILYRPILPQENNLLKKIAHDFGLTDKEMAQEFKNIKNILAQIRGANLNSLQRRLLMIVIENDQGEGVYRRIVESEARFDYMSQEFFDEMMVLQHKGLIDFDDENQVFAIFGGYETWELINTILGNIKVDLDSLIKDPSFELLFPNGT